jgi:dipeptidyl aminopeptidase/acylaminoacyl peptidase
MKLASLFAVLSFAPCAALAGVPSVAEHFGNVEFTGADSTTRMLTRGGQYGEPVLGPDGRTVAFIHIDAAATGPGQDSFNSLYVADGATGKVRRLIAPKEADAPKDRLAAFSHPIFSLDGHYIYVSAEAWATSPAVHQINVETGAERFVIDGAATRIIRTGPYRGYLIVGRHRYYPAPKLGSYDASYVVRPDAKEVFMIPGSDNDDKPDAIARWLKAKGWAAW